MYKKISISVVIPCYNEEKGIVKVLSEMPNYIDEVLVIDNNSKDKSVDNARSFRPRLISEPKQGYGAALKTGILKAKGDIIVTLDGDGTYPSKTINKLVSFLLESKADFVSATRINNQYHNSYPPLHLLASKIFTILVWILFRHKITDLFSGMMCFKRTIVSSLALTSRDMRFGEEIKLEVLRNRSLKYAEFPIEFNFNERLGEKKLQPWRDGFKCLGFLFVIRFRLKNLLA